MFDDLIREHGWAVQGVCNPRGSPGPSGWAYTIGLEDRDRPELLIVGLPMSTAHGLLNDVITEAVDGARRWPSVGDTIVGLAQGGYGLRVVEVDVAVAAGGDWFLGALARRGGAAGFRPLHSCGSSPTTRGPTEIRSNNQCSVLRGGERRAGDDGHTLVRSCPRQARPVPVHRISAGVRALDRRGEVDPVLQALLRDTVRCVAALDVEAMSGVRGPRAGGGLRRARAARGGREAAGDRTPRGVGRGSGRRLVPGCRRLVGVGVGHDGGGGAFGDDGGDARAGAAGGRGRRARRTRSRPRRQSWSRPRRRPMPTPPIGWSRWRTSRA